MPSTATALKRRLAPSVPFTLDVPEDGGKRFKLDLRLAFDFAAMAQVEEITGKSMLDGDIWNKPTAKLLSVMFWASLLAHQPKYEGIEGLAVVQSYMGPDNAAEITNVVMKAFVASLPEEQQEALLKKQPSPLEPAGSSSGPLPDTISGLASLNSEV